MTLADALTPATWTDKARVAALRAYGVLHTAPEADFDDLVGLTAQICDAPTALISLIDDDTQWFKARVGMDLEQTPRKVSFCDHAMQTSEVMVVADATRDPRFADNALVTGSPGIRFYAGAPLVGAGGMPLGALCVIDYRPRPEGLTALQRQALTVLARQVMTQMDLRRAVAAGKLSDVSLSDAIAALSDSEAKFRAIADSMPQMVWSTLPDGFHDYYNARWYEFTGTVPGSTDGEGWNAIFHPDDQARAWKVWRHSLDTGDLYEIEYRLRHSSGVYRWTLGRAAPIRNAAGQITRWFGTCTDIDDLKRMDQAKELLSQELSHRIKNIFAVVSALVALSARQFPEAKAFAASLRTRINALGRAHEFVRPHTDVSRPTVGSMTLHAFLADLFKPYSAADGRSRVRIVGDDTVFDDQAATSVALLFHELATNAAKYGALSVADGWVDLDTRRQGDRFVLVWSEHGGPPVAGEPDRKGFGSSLATLSVEGQLGGSLKRDWSPGGLILRVDLPDTALSRRRAAMTLGHTVPENPTLA